MGLGLDKKIAPAPTGGFAYRPDIPSVLRVLRVGQSCKNKSNVHSKGVEPLPRRYVI